MLTLYTEDETFIKALMFEFKIFTNEGEYSVEFKDIDLKIQLKLGIENQLHQTEIKYPLQTKRFREILDEMYRVHLEKNRDYSPMNILATGMVGVATRIWDKTARILSLLGWNLQTGEYSQERKSANDESIEDNLKDLGVYSIIARLLREDKWGK